MDFVDALLLIDDPQKRDYADRIHGVAQTWRLYLTIVCDAWDRAKGDPAERRERAEKAAEPFREEWVKAVILAGRGIREAACGTNA